MTELEGETCVCMGSKAGRDVWVCAIRIWDGMRWDGMRWDGMGWDGMGWDGMGWDGMGWEGMRWDEMGSEVGGDEMGSDVGGDGVLTINRRGWLYRHAYGLDAA